MWEKIDESIQYTITYRMKVLGGWIVRTDCLMGGAATALVFVPDPNYEWELKK